MREKGDPYEIAVTERVNGIFKSALHLNNVSRSRVEAEMAVQNSVAGYNRLRPHMSCNYLALQHAHQSAEPLIKSGKGREKYYSVKSI